MALRDIFIAAVDEGEAFNPAVHNRHDFDAVGYVLRKPGEADFWSCDVTIRNPGLGPFRPGAKRRVHISEQVDGIATLVFTGRIQGWPLGKAGSTVTMTVLGAPVDREAVETAALAAVNDDPWHLFHDATDKRDSANVLAARFAALNWKRDDSAPTVVDLITGNGLFDIGNAFVEGSLQFEQLAQPVTCVEVSIKAEWEQSVLITADIGSALGDFDSAQSGSRYIKSVGVGERVGDWTIIQSGLELQAVHFETVLVGVENDKALDAGADLDIYPVRLNRHSFTPHIWACCVASARRSETLKFTLNWGGQDLVGYDGQTESVELECRDLVGRVQVPEHVGGSAYDIGNIVTADGMLYQCNSAHIANSSLYIDWLAWDPLLINDVDPLGGAGAEWFFKAPGLITAWLPPKDAPDGWPVVTSQTVARNPAPGVSALAFGFGQAKAKILSGVRIIRASFDVPWEDVRAMTGAERVRLVDVDIPGGEIVGKIVSAEVDLVRGIASITIASAPGKGTGPAGPVIPDYPTIMLGGAGVVSAGVARAFPVQVDELATWGRGVGDYLDHNQTELGFALSPAPRGADLPIEINLGTFEVDCDQMIDLEAAA